MRTFETRREFDAALGGAKKWVRTGEALDAAGALLPGVAYSIGDSLTYRRGTAAELAVPDLIGRRRYHLVVAATSGAVRLEVAPKAGLVAGADYDDLSDRQPFVGAGDVVDIPEGGIAIVDIDEAARLLPDDATAAVQLHVSVEGATFHNK